MNYTFGFIGVGNMGGALAAAVKKGNADFSAILSDMNTKKADSLANELGCVSGDTKSVAETAKYIFLGVKPQMLEELAKEILLEKEIEILISLGKGEGFATAWGCDLTYDYVKINGDYRT